MTTDTKTCPDCGVEKPGSEFYLNSRTKSGLSTYCKLCTDTRNADWNKNNSDKRKAYRQKYARTKEKRLDTQAIREKIAIKESKLSKLLREILRLKRVLGENE